MPTRGTAGPKRGAIMDRLELRMGNTQVHETCSESPMQAAVETAIEQMHADAPCEEGITGLAVQVFYSKFHFSREFHRLTGTTPRRFLASVRMQQAKLHLLVGDSGIAYVSNLVGYSSVGTFSTRFTELVGASPRQWRVSGGHLDRIDGGEGVGQRCVQGRIRRPESAPSCPGPVFVGAYPDRVLQGAPVAWALAEPDGTFQLRGVPDGRWVIIASAAGTSAQPETFKSAELRQELMAYGFLEVGTEPQRRALQLDLRPRCILDPPMLFERTGLPGLLQERRSVA